MTNRHYHLMLVGVLVLAAWPQSNVQTAVGPRLVLNSAGHSYLTKGTNAGVPTALLLSPSFSTSTESGNPAGATIQLPGGNWTVGAHPVWTDGSPVNVAAVTLRADQGLSISSVKVKNLSPQKITAVKLAWYIFSEQGGDQVLRSGSTPRIAIAISPQASGVIEYSVVSFANEAASLSTSGNLSGAYHVAVAIAEARFEDGSGYSPNSETLALKWLKWFTTPGVGCYSCQNQRCAWSYIDKCYRCENGPCETCTWHSCNSCTVSRCGQ